MAMLVTRKKHGILYDWTKFQSLNSTESYPDRSTLKLRISGGKDDKVSKLYCQAVDYTAVPPTVIKICS